MNTEITEVSGLIRSCVVALTAIFATVAAFQVQRLIPAWVFMWLVAAALFLVGKWLTLSKRASRGFNLLPYIFAWPGMDAGEFFGRSSGSCSVSGWAAALIKTAFGASLLLAAAYGAFAAHSLARGWLGMIGLVLFLHFGVFHLLCLAWRRAGVKAQPIMRAPLRATSLTDFWSRRWNTAFNTLAHQFIFKRLARRHGIAFATLGTFLISGLVHEAVISWPARGGYGLPTAYFAAQGLGVLAERSRFGRNLGLGGGFFGWLFTILITAGPVFWLFHPPFVHNVILPLLDFIGGK